MVFSTRNSYLGHVNLHPMRYLILFLSILLALSCKTDPNSAYTNTIRYYLTDSLKKDGIVIDSIRITELDTITERSIERYILNQNMHLASIYLENSSNSNKLVKIKMTQLKLSGIIGNSMLVDMTKDEIKEYLAEAKLAEDTASMYIKFSDSLQKGLNKKDSVKPVYILAFPIIYGVKNWVIDYQDSTPVYFKDGKIVQDLNIKYDYIRH
jgi:hypothetical protein